MRVNATFAFWRVASALAVRRPLMIDSAVERISLLRRKVDERRHAEQQQQREDRERDHQLDQRESPGFRAHRQRQQSPFLRLTQQVADVVQPDGTAVVARALAWSIVNVKPPARWR